MILPKQLFTVTGAGNPKWDKAIADVLNNNPKFRKAAERIAKRETERIADEILFGKPGEKATIDFKEAIKSYKGSR